MTETELKRLIVNVLNQNASRCMDDEEDVDALAENLVEWMYPLVEEAYNNTAIHQKLG